MSKLIEDRIVGYFSSLDYQAQTELLLRINKVLVQPIFEPMEESNDKI